MFRRICLVLAIFSTSIVNVFTHGRHCFPQYYVEYGEKAFLKCNFTIGFVGVVWYVQSDQRPIISLQNGKVTGPGYESGKLNITSEGWLMINHVHYENDGYFTVVVYYTNMKNLVEEDVQSIVFVRPHPPFPKVDQCGDKNSCLVSVTETSEFRCSVRRAKPFVSLDWYQKKDNRDKRLEYSGFSNKEGKTFSSFSSVNVSVPSFVTLKVISCKSYSLFPVLQFNETTLLLERTDATYPLNEGTPVYQYLNTDVMLDCAKDSPHFLLWKARSDTDGLYTTVGYIAYGRSEVFESNRKILSNGSLILKKFQVHDEGEYICVYTSQNQVVYNGWHVKAFIPPSPPFPQITGCEKFPAHCARTVDKEGYLSCSVQGIRPPVHLAIIYSGNYPSPIIFSNLVYFEDPESPVFNIRITKQFKILVTESLNITVECKADGPNVDKFKSTSEITLSYHNPATGGCEQHLISIMLIVCICVKVLLGFR